MALYEVVLIARQNLSAEEVDSLNEKFVKIINDGKGKIVSKEYWGLRKLSYEIDNNKRAHYLMLNIDSSNENIQELKRVIGFTEEVIRSMIFAVKEHQIPSKLRVSETAKDFKDGKLADAAKSDFDLGKIVINNI